MAGTVPDATATVSVEVEGLVMELEESVGVSPGSEVEVVSETVLENPRIGVRLIVDVPELPAMIVTGSGLADRVKSGPITRTSTKAE